MTLALSQYQTTDTAMNSNVFLFVFLFPFHGICHNTDSFKLNRMKEGWGRITLDVSQRKQIQKTTTTTTKNNNNKAGLPCYSVLKQTGVRICGSKILKNQL